MGMFLGEQPLNIFSLQWQRHTFQNLEQMYSAIWFSESTACSVHITSTISLIFVLLGHE